MDALTYYVGELEDAVAAAYAEGVSAVKGRDLLRDAARSVLTAWEAENTPEGIEVQP